MSKEKPTVNEIISEFTAVEPDLNIHVLDKAEKPLYHGKGAHVFPKIGEFNATRVVLVIEAEEPPKEEEES